MVAARTGVAAVNKPEYLSIKLTRRQVENAEAALGNLMRNADEFMDIGQYKWEAEALWRLRAALINAQMEAM